jgi:hypothetical protein
MVKMTILMRKTYKITSSIKRMGSRRQKDDAAGYIGSSAVAGYIAGNTVEDW